MSHEQLSSSSPKQRVRKAPLLFFVVVVITLAIYPKFFSRLNHWSVAICAEIALIINGVTSCLSPNAPKGPEGQSPYTPDVEVNSPFWGTQLVDDFEVGAVTCKSAVCHERRERAVSNAVAALWQGGQVEARAFGDNKKVSTDLLARLKDQFPLCAAYLAGSRYARHSARSQFLTIRACVLAHEIAKRAGRNLQDLIDSDLIVISADERADELHVEREIEVTTHLKKYATNR